MIVWCGNLTILLLGLAFHCFLLHGIKKSLYHSLGKPSRSDFVQFMFGKDFPNITIDNHKVLGIPVILYMALSVGVHIEDGGSKAELYERIFALKGGIFDRFESSKNNAYESGKHLIQDIKKEFKVILQKTALQIFIKKEAPLTNKEYLEIANSIIEGNKENIFDFPIKNLYEEGNGIEFVHKSIYEYFVAEYMFQEIYRDGVYKDAEELAGVLGRILGEEILSKEIEEFLKYKVKKYIITDSTLHYFSDAFHLMLENGMSYYSKIIHKEMIIYESYVFYNTLAILHFEKYNNDKILKADKFKLRLYINGGDNSFINLAYVDLRYADLTGANLREANLRGADLRETDLRGADLTGADLTGANLRGADLREADLRGANLIRANLRGADLREADLRGAKGVYLSS